MAQSAAEIAAQWAQRMGASTDKWRAGVEGVSVAPGQAAARQADVWANNTVAAKQLWAQRVAGVSLQDWKDAMINKGQSRIASGATAAQSKMADFFSQLLPQIDRVKSSLPARGGLDQNINRMVAFSRGMASWNYKK